jgi:hypothetical protein
MAAQSNLSLADGQAAPVTQTFYAGGVKPDQSGAMVAKYGTRETSGIGIASRTVTIGFRESASKTEIDKRITLPSLEVISGSDGGYTPKPKVAFNLFSREQFVLPTRASLAERKDLLAFSKNLNADAVMQNAVWNLEPVW